VRHREREPVTDGLDYIIAFSRASCPCARRRGAGIACEGQSVGSGAARPFRGGADLVGVTPKLLDRYVRYQNPSVVAQCVLRTVLKVPSCTIACTMHLPKSCKRS